MASLLQTSAKSVHSPIFGNDTSTKAEGDKSHFCLGEKLPDTMSENAETKEQPRHDRPVRILIVDDNPGVREMMTFMVRRLGYAVATAATGAEALAHIQEQRTDIILLDLTMPDMDGFEVCRVVQRDATLQHLHIIITSARDTFEDKEKCFALGAADYLLKPFSVRELRARLQIREQSIRQQ